MYRPWFLVQLSLFITVVVSASTLPKHFNLFERAAPTTPTLEDAHSREMQSRNTQTQEIKKRQKRSLVPREDPWIEECEEMFEYEVVVNSRTFKRECGVVHVGHDTLPFPSFEEESDRLNICAFPDPTDPSPPCVGFSMKLDINGDGSVATAGDCYLKNYIRPPRSNGPGIKFYPWVSYKIISGS